MYHSIELVDPIERPNLYLKLLIVVLKSSNPEHAEQFRIAYEKTSAIYSVEFLD